MDDLLTMRVRQDGKCAVCREERALLVDHDHTTGLVRELLCHHCNTAIGYLRESSAYCYAAARYLKKHSKKGTK